MGADGHGSAGLPEISEDRVPRSVLITCADAGPPALLVRLHRTLGSFELTGNGQSTRHFESVVESNKRAGGRNSGSSAKTKPCVLVLRVISLSYCHIRGVCTLPGRQIPDGGKHSQFHRNYNQSGYFTCVYVTERQLRVQSISIYLSDEIF